MPLSAKLRCDTEKRKGLILLEMEKLLINDLYVLSVCMCW